MSILTGKQILNPYIKKATGYIKSLLSSQHVEMKDGKTLQTAVDEINNNLTYYIVEQGSNSNGNYRKWSDGTLEMWGRFETLASTNLSANGINYSIVYYHYLPVESVAKGIVFFTTENNGLLWLSGTTAESNKTRFSYRVYALANYSNLNIVIDWHCVGRWN